MSDGYSLNRKVERIGVEGFEPPTYCSQSSRASQAALYPDDKDSYRILRGENLNQLFYASILKIFC